AGLVGRTEWNTSPATRIKSGRCSSKSSTTRRNASATSASRGFPPRGVWRSYWRNPRWRSARWASFTVRSVRLVGNRVQRRDALACGRRRGRYPAAELFLKVRQRVLRSGLARVGERATHVLFPPVRDDVL